MWYLTLLRQRRPKMMVTTLTKTRFENSGVSRLNFTKEKHSNNKFVSIALISYLIVHRFSINVKTRAGGDGGTNGGTDSEKKSR
jgi:hypothetical protein